MEITTDEIIEINEIPYQLFEKGVPNKATWRSYRNMMKKTVCEYLKNILVGNPELVENQKQEMIDAGQKLHYRINYYDADFKFRINELVNRAKDDPKWKQCKKELADYKIKSSCLARTWSKVFFQK